ncbi:MAG: hypothetical protein IJG05_02860 [Solobacterium sp.]|nr:hypothetical protein [Solobacterium sp.]
MTAKTLTSGHVRPLLARAEDDARVEAAPDLLKNKMSVRDVEKYIKTLLKDPEKRKKREVQKDPWIRDLENRMQDRLGTKVEVGTKSFTVSYQDTAGLNRILDLLGLIEESE